MTIAEIEERRLHAGLMQKDLCRRAGIDATTYSLLKRGRRGAYARTLEKLRDALDHLERERGEANGNA